MVPWCSPFQWGPFQAPWVGGWLYWFLRNTQCIITIMFIVWWLDIALGHMSRSRSVGVVYLRTTGILLPSFGTWIGCSVVDAVWLLMGDWTTSIVCGIDLLCFDNGWWMNSVDLGGSGSFLLSDVTMSPTLGCRYMSILDRVILSTLWCEQLQQGSTWWQGRVSWVLLVAKGYGSCTVQDDLLRIFFIVYYIEVVSDRALVSLRYSAQKYEETVVMGKHPTDICFIRVWDKCIYRDWVSK